MNSATIPICFSLKSPHAGGIPAAVLVTAQGAAPPANQDAPDAFNAWLSAFVQIIERLYR